MTKGKFIVVAVIFILAILVAHVISTICTVLIMTSNTTDLLNYWVMFGMAIILQLTTSVFISKAIIDTSLPWLIRAILLTVSVFLFFASIIANVGLIQNNSNKTQNIAVRESVEYKQALQTNTNQQKKLDSKLAEKKSETITYDNAITAIENSLNDSKTDWERNKYTTMLNNKTTEKTNTLARIEKELNGITISPIDTKTISISSENGYSATFLFLSESKIVKWIFRGASKELLEYYYYISLSTVFELINLLSVYLFCMFLKKHYELIAKKTPTPDPEPKRKKPTPTPTENSPKLNLVKSNSALGLKASRNFNLRKTPKNISDFDIEKYLKYMYENAKDNISPGYIKISKNVDGLPQEKCRKIKAWLEQEGIVKNEGGRTLIVKNKSLVG